MHGLRSGIMYIMWSIIRRTKQSHWGSINQHWEIEIIACIIIALQNLYYYSVLTKHSNSGNGKMCIPAAIYTNIKSHATE